MTNSRIHEYPITIELDDIDFMGHVDNASYLKWVQAAVIDHWVQHTPRRAQASYRWIAIKHEIIYRKPAFLADQLVALLSLDALTGARARYMTAIARGNETVVDVVSSWCCVDARTFRPVRLARDVVELFLPSAAPSTPRHGIG